MENKDVYAAQNSIITGVIWKQLLIFFFPIMLGNFFQQFYNTIDAVVVGQFVGKNALAAIGGSAAAIINLIIGFFGGIGSGASVIISRYFGSQDRSGVSKSIRTIYAFSLISSIFVTIIGVILAPYMLSSMNTPKELMEESVLYLRIYFVGIVFVFIYNIGSFVLRALGDSKRPLIYLIICSFINIVLDIVTVVGFKMGVAGVAIATMIAQAVSAFLVTRALTRETALCDFAIKDIKIHKDVLKAQLLLGLPGGIQTAMYSVSNMIIQTAVNGFGTNSTAAWAAYGKLDAIFWMISGSFGIAITTFVGQNFGAGRFDRVKKSVKVCIGMDLIVSIIMTIVLIVFRVPLFKIFTTDAEVVELGAYMLSLMAPYYSVFVFIEILSGALRGMGDAIIPMLMTMFGVCILRIAWIVFVLPVYPKIETIVLNYPISWILTSVLLIGYYWYKISRMKEYSGEVL